MNQPPAPRIIAQDDLEPVTAESAPEVLRQLPGAQAPEVGYVCNPLTAVALWRHRRTGEIFVGPMTVREHIAVIGTIATRDGVDG